jgi:hypothetical protein
MNEKDLEQRLRSVVDGPKPSAPPSLRRFLRDLPETQADRRRRPLGVLRQTLGWLPGLLSPAPLARRAQVLAAVSMALVIGLAGAGILLSLRHAPPPPAATQLSSISTPTAPATPRRSSPVSPSPLRLTLPDNPIWVGTIQYGNEDQALPLVVASTSDGAYVGVSAPPYGQYGIVRSRGGLYWDWSPLSEIDPKLTELKSIASDTTGRIVVVGAAQGVDGSMDGRVYLSDDGATWQPATDQSVFAGIVVRTVVHGPRGFVALGWNDASQADAIRPVTEWFSADGLSWARVSGVPIRGTYAYVFATASGYLLSGTPLQTGNVDQPPFWYSPDGQNWQRATVTDNTAQQLGSLSCVTLLYHGELIGLTKPGNLSDGSGTQLVESADGGLHWNEIKPEGLFSGMGAPIQVASLAASAEQQWLVATYNEPNSRMYVSTDGGMTWNEAIGDHGSPLGMVLVELGNGYQGGPKKVLAFGTPDARLGIWLAVTQEADLP